MSESKSEPAEPKKPPHRKRPPIPAVTYSGASLQYYDDDGTLQSAYVDDAQLVKVLELLNIEHDG